MTAMAIIEQAEPKQRLWTSTEYYRMAELGFFQEQRVQLVEGEIVQLSPQSNVHAAAIEMMAQALRKIFGDGYWVRNQMTLDLSPISTPDPDLAVVQGDVRQAPKDNPSTAVLVIEVSETTLSFDRNAKGSMYAKVGIQDYWIINLADRQLEVYREPQKNASGQYGYFYAERKVVKGDQKIAALAKPDGMISVKNIMPK